MNERTIELAKKSMGLAHVICKDLGHTVGTNDSIFIGILLGAFSESIVQKCADIGERYADGNYEVRNQILEHFGMEEE